MGVRGGCGLTVSITRPDTRVTDETVAHLDNEVRGALPGWHVERDRAADDQLMVYGRDERPIFSGTLFDVTAFVMGARAGFKLAERRAGKLRGEPGRVRVVRRSRLPRHDGQRRERLPPVPR